ncbi:MAG: hypothetical protein PHE24_01510 [Patescibacteria group bacterium]|nr:hypothetical protein [Patescibacteria group bacterium]
MNKKAGLLFCSLILCLLVSGCEKEGTIKVDDCRESVEIKEFSFDAIFGNFICNYKKTDNGKLIFGECSRVKMKDGECQTEFWYEKKPFRDCGEYSYIDERDGNCVCVPSYEFDINSKKCISKEDNASINR